MSGSVNKVILIGNLGADPEIRALPSGNKIQPWHPADRQRCRLLSMLAPGDDEIPF